MKKLHMISGLPRSGSTLLASILNQNPRFSSGISNPLNEAMHNVTNAFSTTGNRTQMTEKQRINVLGHMIDGYYLDDPAEVVFNTSRAWTSSMYMMNLVRPDAKVICCVRDYAWILDSFEILFQRDPTLGGFNGDRGKFNFNNVYARTNIQANEGILGKAHESLKEAFYSNHNNKLHIVEYNDLCSNPTNTIKKIYNFIEEPFYEHDYDNVEMKYEEYDMSISMEGLHNVRKKVEFKPRPSILPRDLFEKYTNTGYEFWR